MRVIVAFLLVFLITIPAMATTTGTTGLAQRNNACPYIAEYWEHTHSYTDNDTGYKNPMGLGIDVTVFECEPKLTTGYIDEVTVENRYDMHNGAYTLYGVAKVNLFKALQDLF